MTVPDLPLAVLDTNVLGYLFREEPLGTRYARRVEDHAGLIAFQTLAEIRFGMVNARWGEARRAEQEQFLTRFRVIYPTASTCTVWAELRVAAFRAGRPINSDDAWIAATALALRCPLVTHNVNDFAGIPGLTLITENPA